MVGKLVESEVADRGAVVAVEVGSAGDSAVARSSVDSFETRMKNDLRLGGQLAGTMTFLARSKAAVMGDTGSLLYSAYSHQSSLQDLSVAIC